MSHVRRFDHVGITVADLDTVTAFFVGLGLEVEGTRMFVEGEFLDTVIGIPDSRTEIVMLRPPDGGTRLELSSFVRPDHEPGSPPRCPPNWGCATWPSRSTTSRRPSTDWPRTATAWSAASDSTSTFGAWPTCADRRGSSCPWPSGLADAAVVEVGSCALVQLGGRVEGCGQPRVRLVRHRSTSAARIRSCCDVLDRPAHRSPGGTRLRVADGSVVSECPIAAH
jgi:hypothetical protein